jgi:hypothetical protein
MSVIAVQKTAKIVFAHEASWNEKRMHTGQSHHQNCSSGQGFKHMRNKSRMFKEQD